MPGYQCGHYAGIVRDHAKGVGSCQGCRMPTPPGHQSALIRASSPKEGVHNLASTLCCVGPLPAVTFRGSLD